MMLAQAEGVTAQQYAGGLIAVILTMLLPFVREMLKDRRERKADEQSQEYLKAIAQSNQRLADSHHDMNVKLTSFIDVSNERVKNFQLQIGGICKANKNNNQ